jgi:hypothetical protein
MWRASPVQTARIRLSDSNMPREAKLKITSLCCVAAGLRQDENPVMNIEKSRDCP